MYFLVVETCSGSFKLTFLLLLRDEHLDNILLMPCTPLLLKHAQNRAALINGTVKHVQVVFVEKQCSAFYNLRIKPVLQQIRLL